MKKLIEVALPLEKINEESAREKNIRYGHPSTMHLWWARRPLASARAVIWASLVDDPSSHPEVFETEEAQTKERQRLFSILEKLVVWENSNNEEILAEAKKEIRKFVEGELPTLLDPFAGGGTIPLEAQRLGLEAHAHDLNPVAIMINKSMIELPSVFSEIIPVNPKANSLVKAKEFNKATGMADDLKYYSERLREKAYDVVGKNYPMVDVPKEFGGGKATVIAWIWTRTVKCPNPACGCTMPLMRSSILSKKKGKETWFKPLFSGGELLFEIQRGKLPKTDGTVSRKGAICACCGAPVDFDYIRNEGKEKRIGEVMAAVVAEGRNGRIYLQPNIEQISASKCIRPETAPSAELPRNPRDFKTPNYGLTRFEDLFSTRQLLTLTVFSDLVEEIRQEIEEQAVSMGYLNDHIELKDGGRGAYAYSQALAVYLAFIVDKLSDRCSNVCSWINGVKYEIVRNVFSRQAIAMNWDFAEANPFSNSSGCFDNCAEWVYRCLEMLPTGIKGEVSQHSAQSSFGFTNVMVSTDPPYYDNISYADLSDYFYIWMRKSLKSIYPELMSTMLVPKSEELIANPYRHSGGELGAKQFFEDGMLQTCKQIFEYVREDIPVTIYYAYKQSDNDNTTLQVSSTGWETMLSSIIKAGFTITGTWPMRTEMVGRTISNGTNALASSIVLVCRKRDTKSSICTRRNFVIELKRELRPALRKLQQSNIAPVDLAQSAIGPGIAVFSEYNHVLEADGSEMTVRSALQIINQELDVFFNEQDNALDRDSRFCIDLYTQSAFNIIKFGEADTLARAKNTSVASMTSEGILYAQKGMVHLVERSELTKKISEHSSTWLLCQQLTYAMEIGGIEECAKIVAPMFGSAAETAKGLAYRLFTIAERKGWAQEAYVYNALVVSWPDIQSRAATLNATMPKQMSLFE